MIVIPQREEKAGQVSASGSRRQREVTTGRGPFRRKKRKEKAITLAGSADM